MDLWVKILHPINSAPSNSKTEVTLTFALHDLEFYTNSSQDQMDSFR